MSGGRPPAMSRSAMAARVATPMRTTMVPPTRATASLAGAATLDEQGVDVLLLHRRVAGRLAHADPLGGDRGQVEQGRHREPVVDNDIGAAQDLRSPHGE